MQPIEQLGLFHFLLDWVRRDAEHLEAPDRHPIRATTGRFLIRIGTWLEPRGVDAPGGRQTHDYPTAQGVNG